MPELDILTENGLYVSDLCSVVLATMHFPSASDASKRKRLANHYSTQQLFRPLDSDFDPDDPEANAHSDTIAVTFQDLRRARNSEPLEAMVGDVQKHFRDGFLAGHWLLFRIFAAAHAPKLNSNGRWEDYATRYLVPSLPLEDRLKRATNRDSVRKIIRALGPAAHFWAAATYSPIIRRELLANPGSLSRNPLLAASSLFPSRCRTLCREAKGFLEAGIAAGAFAREGSLVTMEKVWTLPAQIESTEPVVEHPDHLIDVDLTALRAQYIYKHAELIKKAAPCALRKPEEQPEAARATKTIARRELLSPPRTIPAEMKAKGG